MDVRREASCSCGRLRAVVRGDPVRVSICHCLACQRRTGGPFGHQARFAREQVAFEGEPRRFVRRSDEGEERVHWFCPDCGSTVWYALDGETDVAIPVGAFADPGFPAPTRSVWEERRHGWVQVPPGAERID